MNNSINRKERRKYEASLKKNNLKEYALLKSQSISRGKQLHLENTQNTQKLIQHQLEEKQFQIEETLRSNGYSEEQINKYIADWITFNS